MTALCAAEIRNRTIRGRQQPYVGTAGATFEPCWLACVCPFPSSLSRTVFSVDIILLDDMAVFTAHFWKVKSKGLDFSNLSVVTWKPEFSE